MPVKFYRKVVVLALVIFAGAVGAYIGFAGADGSVTPGSQDDPVVTKSFVEEYVAGCLKTSSGGAGQQWMTKTIPPGGQVTGGAGMEFIVRAGKALAVDPTGNGIPDVTLGSNVSGGQVLTANHLFIIPRDDRRGISAQTGVVIMYRGSLTE